MKKQKSNNSTPHRNKILEYSGSYAPTNGPQRAPPYNPAQESKGAPPYQPIQTKKAPPYHPDRESTGPPPFHPTIGPPGPPPYGYPHKPSHKSKQHKNKELESPYASEEEIVIEEPKRKSHKLYTSLIHHRAHKESN